MALHVYASCGAGIFGYVDPTDGRIILMSREYTRAELEVLAATEPPGLSNAACVHDRAGYNEHRRIILAQRLLARLIAVEASPPTQEG